MIFGRILLILKGMGKKGKWILRLCRGIWGKGGYGILYLICGKRGCGWMDVGGVWVKGWCEVRR